MKSAIAKLRFNNKGLKQCFPGTKITKKGISMGVINATFITRAIKSIPDLHHNYTNFGIAPRVGGIDGHAGTCTCEGCEGKGTGYEMELEGSFNDWTLSVKINLF